MISDNRGETVRISPHLSFSVQHESRVQNEDWCG